MVLYRKTKTIFSVYQISLFSSTDIFWFGVYRYDQQHDSVWDPPSPPAGQYGNYGQFCPGVADVSPSGGRSGLILQLKGASVSAGNFNASFLKHCQGTVGSIMRRRWEVPALNIMLASWYRKQPSLMSVWDSFEVSQFHWKNLWGSGP